MRGGVDLNQSSGEVDEVQSSGEEQVGPASSEEEQVDPASVQTEDQVQALRRSTRIKMDPSNWVNTRVYYNAQAVEHPSQALCSFAEDGDWSRWAKRALESCGLWCGHVKGKPLVEMATEEGQTRNLKGEDEADQETTLESGIEEAYEERSQLVKLVGRLKEGWMELDVLRQSTSDLRVIKERRKQDLVFSFLVKEVCVLILHACDVWEENKRSNQWKGGTSCKKGRLRKLSRVWLKMGKAWKKDREPGYLSDKLSLKMIKEAAQQVVRGGCSYSAYMSNSVEGSMVMKEKDIKGADERVTKKEWDEFVKHVSAGPLSSIGVKVKNRKRRVTIGFRYPKGLRGEPSVL
ncbi:hypothetical protein F2Q69_00022866 [Brassica cretica]|uniref:Uncharacterized protein n=1 Tax=Brassica cretica TaxID=69181 RepID=A0A8S9QIA4_BRACR|nr:hypothetical protein F2Q69_00022866 [Brassica cretica]